MATRNTKLSLDAKIYVVKALACRERIPDILTALQNDFGVTVDRKALAHYDPRVNLNLDAELKALYEKTAADFWDKKNFEPLNSLNYRQRLRAELYEQASRNPKLRLEILDAAAKDEGGLFSNRREVAGEAAVAVQGVDLTNFATASNEDLARVIASSPLEYVDAATAAFMIDKGWISEDRAGEADIEYRDFGDNGWHWAAKGAVWY